MKMLVDFIGSSRPETHKVDGEGFESLLGKVVTLYCLNYIYTGKLIGVGDTCILLDSPKIVYETGDYNNPKWKDAQALPNQIYIQIACVESFGIIKND